MSETAEATGHPSDPTTIETARLDLVVATPACLHAELADKQALSRVLQAALPVSWPPELYDRNAIEFTLAQLVESPADQNWWMRYIVHRQSKTVIGIAAFKGPPAANGSVEIGYALVEKFQKHGYATEAVNGLLAAAFADPRITRVQAQTLPDLVASIRVLERAGFDFAGPGVEDGVRTVRYELTRASYEQA